MLSEQDVVSAEVNVLLQRGCTAQGEGKYEAALIWLARALQDAERLDHPGLGEVLHRLAQCCSEVGKHQNAHGHYLRLHEMYRGTIDELWCLEGLASSHLSLGQAQQSLQCLEAAVAIAQNSPEHTRQAHLWKLWGQLGRAHQTMGHYRRAIELFKQCQAPNSDQLQVAELLAVASCYQSLGMYWAAAGFLELAAQCFNGDWQRKYDMWNAVVECYEKVGGYEHEGCGKARESRVAAKLALDGYEFFTQGQLDRLNHQSFEQSDNTAETSESTGTGNRR